MTKRALGSGAQVVTDPKACARIGPHGNRRIDLAKFGVSERIPWIKMQVLTAIARS